MADYVIDLSGVSVKYALTTERPKTLQEFFIGLARGKRAKSRNFYALNDITLKVKRGDAIGIIGSNGAGKSTLLKVIAKVIKPTGGKVLTKGKIAPIIELGTGFDNELTGEENIYLNASILGLSKRQINEKFDRIVDFSELENFIYSPMRSYSSGMIARLAFSIAAEVDADILVVDEVLSVGDEVFKKKCQEKIDAIMKRGATLLFVSHSMDEVQRLCETVIWMDGGKIVASGSAEHITKKYLLRRDKTVFQDIPEDHPYRKYISAMFTHGVASGYSINGRRYYNPDNRISRAEFAVFLSKAMGMKKTFRPKRLFVDVFERNPSASHITWVYDRGLIDAARDSRGNLCFHPDGYMKMAEAKEIMSRIDPGKSREVVFGEVDELSRGETARIFYEFFDFLKLDA
jgi:ABC-type polysaccharide/polyol phosphate transport system ATPase subunit